MRPKIITGLFLTAWLALMPALSVVGVWSARLSQHFRAHAQPITEVRWNPAWGALPASGDDVQINGIMMDVVDVIVQPNESRVLLEEDTLESFFSRLFDGQLPSGSENPFMQGDWLEHWLPAELLRLNPVMASAKMQVVFCEGSFRTDHGQVIWQPPEG